MLCKLLLKLSPNIEMGRTVHTKWMNSPSAHDWVVVIMIGVLTYNPVYLYSEVTPDEDKQVSPCCIIVQSTF